MTATDTRRAATPFEQRLRALESHGGFGESLMRLTTTVLVVAFAWGGTIRSSRSRATCRCTGSRDAE